MYRQNSLYRFRFEIHKEDGKIVFEASPHSDTDSALLSARNVSIVGVKDIWLVMERTTDGKEMERYQTVKDRRRTI